MREALWIEASELIVDLGYQSRSHFIVGERLRGRAKYIGIPRVTLPLLALGWTSVSALIGVDRAWVSAFGLTGAVIVALERYFDPVAQADAHCDKADRLLTLYKDLRNYRNVRLRSKASDEELESQLDSLRRTGNELRAMKPRQIPDWAYKRAKEQIDQGQARYLNDPLWESPPECLTEG